MSGSTRPVGPRAIRVHRCTRIVPPPGSVRRAGPGVCKRVVPVGAAIAFSAYQH